MHEFQDGGQLEELLEGINAIEEAFEYKEVPDNKLILLIVTWFYRRAAPYWKQTELIRMSQGKKKIDP